MLTASFRRTVVLIFLVTVLAAPTSPQNDSPGLLNRVLSFLQFKPGCVLDPNGRCINKTTRPPHTKAGCIIDPDGRCLP